MKNQKELRERYLRDTVPVRLGGLAANLARIKSFSNHPEHRGAVEKLIEESKFFIEWTALETDFAIQRELVDLQLQLAQWHYHWEDVWADPERLAIVIEEANKWSRRILEISGLLS